MAPTYYAATARLVVEAPPLDGPAQADLCIVGGGLTGLSAALHAARRGLRVVLLERGELGDGASGRNGGQVHIGMRRDQEWLEARLGKPAARALWQVAQDARASLMRTIADEEIDCDFRPGLLHLDHRPRYVADSRRSVEWMREHYADHSLRFVPREEARALVNSADYHGGIHDSAGGQIHPLDLTRGIARAAQRAGATVHAMTAATQVTKAGGGFRIDTPRGTVTADRVLLAGNGYLGDLDRTVAAHVAPLNNYIAVTEPLGAAAADLIREPLGVSDSRVVVYYFRRTSDDRILFGGGEGYAQSYPTDVAAVVRRHMLRIFPQLRSARIDYAWGGTLAVTANRQPYVRQLQPGLYAIAGYCGVGVVLAPYFGRLLAEALTGGSADFDRLTDIRVPPLSRRAAAATAAAGGRALAAGDEGPVVIRARPLSGVAVCTCALGDETAPGVTDRHAGTGRAGPPDH